MAPEYTNPFNILGTMANYGLQAAGAWMYATLNPLPGSSWNYSPSANQIFLNNGYTANSVAFRDANLARRVQVLKEKAKQANIDPAIVENNAYWIQMLMRADTPQVREMIRKQLPMAGDMLLWLFDSLTGAEVGMDKVYEGLADPYGTKAGNEAALYATNFIENYIRNGQQKYADGTRDIDAGVVAGGLQALKKYHYNFAASIGADENQRASRSDLFANIYNQTDADGSVANTDLQKAAQSSYIRNILNTTTDKEDKKKLTELLSQAEDGTLDLSDLPDKFKSISAENISEFAAKNEAKLYREAVIQDIRNETGYFKKFEEFAKAEKFDLNKTGATDEEKANFAKSLAKLKNRFATRVVDDYVNKKPEDREFKNVENSALDKVYSAIQDVDKAWKENREAENRESMRVMEYTRAMYAVGQAAWSELSSDEQKKYMDAGGGNASRAKALLGAERMGKFASSYMNRFDVVGASLVSLQVEAGRKAAHLSDTELSQNASFMGSILQNKNLLPTVTMASNAWIAAAEQKFGHLDPFEIQEQNQRLVRATESAEGRMLYMFMGQDFKEGSELDKLQKAIKNQDLSPQQYEYLKKSLRDPGSFRRDIADATGKDPATLSREAQYLETNRDRQDPATQAFLSNLIAKGAADIQDDDLITEDRLFDIISRKSKDNLKHSGLSKTRSSAKILTDLIQSNFGDPLKLVRGDLTDDEIKKLKNKHLAKFARERKAAKREALKDIEDPKERALAEWDFDREAEYAVRLIYADAMGSEQAAKRLGRIVSLDTAKQSKEQGENAKKDYLEARVPKPPSEQTPIQAVGEAMGKQIKDADVNKYLDPLIKGIKSVWDSFKPGGGDSTGQTMANAFAKALPEAMKQPTFQQAYASALAGATKQS